MIFSISTFLVINTLSQSVAAAMKDLFRNNARFDVVVWVQGEDRQMDRLLYQTPGVTGVLMTPAAFGIEVVGTGTGLAKIHGAPRVGFLDYWDIRLLGSRSPAEVMEELDAGRNILVTSLMRDKLGLSVGDVITLRLSRGDVPYRVIGFFQSYNSGGSFVLISDRFLRVDMKGEFWSQFGVKVAGDADEVAASLKRNLKDRSWFIRTIDEDEQINYEQFRTLFDMLNGFSILVLIISLLALARSEGIQARISIAEQELAALRNRLDQPFLKEGTVVSPLDDAVVSEISHAAGDLVEPGHRIMKLSSLEGLVVKADVLEEFIRDVKVGATVTIRPTADKSKEYTGKVTVIGQMAFQARSGETTVPVEISLDHADDFLLPGFNVELKIHK